MFVKLHFWTTDLKYQISDAFSLTINAPLPQGRDDNGGNRLVTVLMYLSDVEEGGETVFPEVSVVWRSNCILHVEITCSAR